MNDVNGVLLESFISLDHVPVSSDRAQLAITCTLALITLQNDQYPRVKHLKGRL